METEYKILDHGYLKYIEHWGSEERIIEAARMSTSKGFLGWGPKLVCDECGDEIEFYDDIISRECGRRLCLGTYKSVPGDEKLLTYLFTQKPKHSTPFEMAGLVIEVQAPIMVFREWHRHRVQSYSEMSARYTPLPNVDYIPTVERLLLNSSINTTNRQAGTVKGASELDEKSANDYIDQLKIMYKNQEELYQSALKSGIPKELARLHLPVARYSRMRASANLLNWFKFLSLRMPVNAQWEIREYANALFEMISQLFPRVSHLFSLEKGGV